MPLSLAAMEQLLREAGAKRIGEDAKAALREACEEYAKEVGEKAAALAAHAGRRTVKAADVKLARK
ncbi:MAG: NFYB/HAP3 family transcription factor subunit [Candidatus Woesearchaeota archaeon]|nr:NFYB/HAP3 family transcription factor subunit [Candidatus Woesearchaeota archaeon]